MIIEPLNHYNRQHKGSLHHLHGMFDVDDKSAGTSTEFLLQCMKVTKINQWLNINVCGGVLLFLNIQPSSEPVKYTEKLFGGLKKAFSCTNKIVIRAGRKAFTE